MPVLFILVSMAMIPLVEPARNEYLAELERKGKNNFFRMMAHKPEVLKNFVPFYGAIMGPGRGRPAHQGTGLPGGFFCGRVRLLPGGAPGVGEEGGNNRGRDPGDGNRTVSGFQRGGARGHSICAGIDGGSLRRRERRSAVQELQR